MPQQRFPVNREVEMVLLALQVFQVLFLWVHDWIPLGRLNDVAAVRSQDTRRRLVTVTLIQSVPWTIGLCFSLLHFRRPYPDWVYDWLVISYGLLFIGQIRAWWIPYLFRPEPKRAARYQILFDKTHSFLPPRNGIVPNTVHILLHRLDQIWALPPSTNSSIPVTKLESSDARNNATLATSSGSPMRPIGMVDTIRAITSADCRFARGVLIGPGLTTCERIWRSLRSVVQVRAKERIAALLAA